VRYRELTCRARDGVSLYAKQWGAGAAACVLVHGFGNGSYVWDRFSPAIGQFFTTVTVDLRGHGESSWDPAGRYEADGHVDDVIDLIDALGINRFMLVGHSLGGDLSIRIAARWPERVIGAVIVDFGPELSQEGADRIRDEFNYAFRTWSTVGEYATWLRVRRPLADPAMIEEMARGALRAEPGFGFRLKCDPALGNAYQAGQQAGELWGMLRRIASPILVIRGLASAVRPSRRLMARCAGFGGDLAYESGIADVLPKRPPDLLFFCRFCCSLDTAFRHLAVVQRLPSCISSAQMLCYNITSTIGTS
jgi:pimeloyl-ACP methyl ester carboxylesterase